MRPMPAIVDAMTPFPLTIECSATLSAAVSMMYAKSIRHLPVVVGNKLVGILTDRDAKLALAVQNRSPKPCDLLVEDVCIDDAYIVPHSEKLNVVLNAMVERHIGSALVVKGEKLVGIFTVTDACRRLSELMRIHYPDA